MNERQFQLKDIGKKVSRADTSSPPPSQFSTSPNYCSHFEQIPIQTSKWVESNAAPIFTVFSLLFPSCVSLHTRCPVLSHACKPCSLHLSKWFCDTFIGAATGVVCYASFVRNASSLLVVSSR
jgi:hypothetical protein